MTSIIGSYYTLSACIDKIPDMELEDWTAFNEEQKKYLEIYKNCRGAKIPEIESRVSIGDVTPVNDFLRERGFDIQLDPIRPRDLAIASILEVFIKWVEKGEKTTLHYENVAYNGVDLDSGVLVQSVRGFGKPVAVIRTQNGDTVYMTVPTSKPSNSFETFEIARKLLAETGTQIGVGWVLAQGYEDEVIFPMIDLLACPDISWIVGMSDALKEKWEIAQALQQTKVKMDEEGVTIKEAVAIGVYCASFPERVPLRIDEPFLFVVERKGLKEPLFSAFLAIDGWVKQ